MLKKLLLGLGIAWFLWVGSLVVVNAQTDFNIDSWFGAGDSSGIGVLGWETDQGWGLIQTIKNFINWALWLLSLIALVILLFWWFKMITAAGDETKYKDWFKVLKQAWIWLAVIWLSWFIVSIIFWVIKWSTWTWGGWA